MKKPRPKPASREHRFQKLRALNCYQEVYDRLCAGWPLGQVARFIQEERGEYKQISRSSLEQQLTAFRKQMPPGDLVQKRFPEVFEEAKEKVEKSLNELAELEELYRIQMHRVGVDFKTEQAIKKLLPSMTAEIREARQLLESIANLKLEMGLLRRAERGVNVSVGVEVEGSLGDGTAARFGDAAVRAVLEDPESRRKVMGVVERFMKLPAAKDTN